MGAVRGRHVIHRLLKWLLINAPNFAVLPRISEQTGSVTLVHIPQLNTIKVWDTSLAMEQTTESPMSFGSGIYACPAESLARVSMLLTLRILFSPRSPAKLDRRIG